MPMIVKQVLHLLIRLITNKFILDLQVGDVKTR